MSHAEDIKRWEEYVKQRGWRQTIYPTPHDRVLRIIGLECPPLIFWSPFIVGLISGIFFGLFWTIFMYFVVWSEAKIWQLIFIAVSAGVCFGIPMAIFHIWIKKKLGIGKWKDFVKDPN